MNTSSSSKVNETLSKDPGDLVTINKKVSLTKQQNHVLKMICDTYEMSISKYMEQALVEAMRFDIEEGNFSDALLEKIGGDDNKKDNNSCPSSSGSFFPGPTTQELDLLRKLQTHV